ncbi:MAG: sulfatase [Deltaproteobacteria bacterium]|nr:sulfatase [Deltaproteobacteria bacterium]MBW2400980.1 sulfatase [Deltaproteobacteria bacterium]MBW2664708.1 sulfatase [Deltaproteobacteria bacterium]
MRGLAIGVALLACACTGDEPPLVLDRQARSILLVTLDTTRADRIGAYGYGRATTPTLDRLASEGILFEQVLAPTPITLPSHVSILTGVMPPAHGVRDNGFRLGDEAVTIAELLAARGFRTGAFVGSYVLDAEFGVSQGFEVFDGPVARDMVAQRVERRASAVVNSTLEWLDGLASEERFFAWVHFYDPHHPYAPPPMYADGGDPYDGEIAYCDAQIRRLLIEIERRGLGDELLVAVTSDHGEAFGDRGEKTHGIFLYQSTVRVPLILSGKPVAALAGTRVGRTVSTADLAATLLELAGGSTGELAGSATPSLLGAAAAADRDRAVYIETLLPYYSHRWRGSRGIVWQGQKWIDGGEGGERFDLANDPHDGINLAGTDPERDDALEARLEREIAAQADLGWTAERELDAVARRRLEALGYAVADVADDPFDASLPDAARRIGDLDLFDRSATLVTEWLATQNSVAGTTATAGRWRLDEARRLLLQIRSVNADDPQLPAPLGLVEAALGNIDVAIPLLEAAANDRSADAVLHTNLARAYAAAGRGEDGARHLREQVERDPRHPRYYIWLAEHYLDVGEPVRAAWWLARFEANEEARGAAQGLFDDWTRRFEARIRERGAEPLSRGEVSDREPRGS